MVEFLEFVLLTLALLVPLSGFADLTRRARLASDRTLLATAGVAGGAFLGALLLSVLLHEPVPRVHDEFSYMLMGDAFAHGLIASPSPPLPEFFDTFHILLRPVYASKYFPAQGLFLALGEKLTGHPAVGVWLSSALACAATYWMLRAWIGPAWAPFGAFLMVVQYGVYSYWSQTYWGGMVAALGGALALGSARRLWEGISWKNSAWFALGIVILVNSRPLEGILALLPITGLLTFHLWRGKIWKQTEFWSRLILPAGAILTIGAVLTGSYNRAITGSPWKPPYVLHEQQYQESPQFSFLPLRPKITYSSPWVQYYYEVQEMRVWQGGRIPKYLASGIARKLATWWDFFCGILLTPALVIPPLLCKGRIRYIQLTLLVGFATLFAISTPLSFALRGIIDVLALVQIVVLWITFDDFWPRLAIATSTLLILESWLTKYFFPHYFAPAACLILYLQIDGLRRIWEWNPQAQIAAVAQSRQERRRLERENKKVSATVPRLRGFVYLLPFACLISLVVRVEARIQGWKEDPHGPDRQALLMNDWSLRRADLEHWLEQQPGPQLVFVWYSARHRVNDEWVYNHADLVHSKVLWARNLGAEHNRLLLQQFPDRTVWLVDADRRDPQLIPYSEIDRLTAQPVPQQTAPTAVQDQPDDR